MGLSFSCGFLRKAGPDSFSPQLDQCLSRVQATDAHQLLEQRLDGDRVAFRCAWESSDHRGGNAMVLLKDDRVQELSAGSEALFGLHRDARSKRRRRTPPLGDGELGVEVALYFFPEDWHGRGEQAPCGCDVPPYQRFTVGQEAVPRLANRFCAKDPNAGVIAFGSTPGGFASGAFEQSRRQAAGRKGACCRGAKPIAARVFSGDQRQRESIDVVDRTDRQAEGERDAGTYRPTAQGALRSKGELGGDGHERRSVAFAQALKDHPAELALDRARGQRRGDLVQRRGGGRTGEPVELLDEATFEGDLQAPQQCAGIEPLERDGTTLVDDGTREGRHALAPRGLPLHRGGQSVQGRQAFEPFPGSSTHPPGF